MALIDLLTLITAALVPAGASAVWSWIVTFDWGSFPDYLAGLGAVAALIWARKAVKAANRASEAQDRQLQILIEERREARRADDRNQADKVSAWIRLYQPNQTDIICVRNASDAPVYNACIAVIQVTDGKVLDISGIRVIPPANDPLTIELSPELAAGLRELLPNVIISFQDAAGLCWVRQGNGSLEESTGEANDESFRVLKNKFDSDRS